MDLNARLKGLIQTVYINWKTSGAGALAAMIPILNKWFDWNLASEDLVLIMGSVIAFAFMLTRDANVTSEGTYITSQRIEHGEEIEMGQMRAAAKEIDQSRPK